MSLAINQQGAVVIPDWIKWVAATQAKNVFSKVDIYVSPCVLTQNDFYKCQPPEDQVNNIVTAVKLYAPQVDTIWINMYLALSPPPPPVNEVKDKQERFVKGLQQAGFKVGVLMNAPFFQQMFGTTSYAGLANGTYLWWEYDDQVQDIFTGFNPFGGWQEPVRHTYEFVEMHDCTGEVALLAVEKEGWSKGTGHVNPKDVQFVEASIGEKWTKKMANAILKLKAEAAMKAGETPKGIVQNSRGQFKFL